MIRIPFPMFSFIGALSAVLARYADDLPVTVHLSSGEEQAAGSVYSVAAGDALLGTIAVEAGTNGLQYTVDVPE